MENFIPGQRWISNTESELGLGIILEVDFNRITVVFLACGEKRVYSMNNPPLTRVRFSAGDVIESSDEVKLTVRELIENDGLITYHGLDKNGKEIQLEEIELNHHIQFNKPQDRLFTGQIDPSNWFRLRYETWGNLRRLQQSPVRGLIGGRTSLLPHQLYIAHETANRQTLRIMLADEVGLGKTIEAGLILHHRLVNGRADRIFIMVPESLVHQWLVEMIRRFNLRFSIFDEERCQEIHSDNPFLSEQFILCSQGFLFDNPHRQQQVLQTDWDMVIVDEAHHLEWTENEPSPEYQFVEKLGLLSPGLILLTATPEQLGKESHFARLRLLDPDRFYSLGQFIEEEKEFEPVADAARLLIEGKPVDIQLQKKLKILLKADNVESLLLNVNDASEAAESARMELINLLLDHHGTGRILFRNSRKTVQGFPQRRRHSYALTELKKKAPGNAASSTEFDPLLHWLVQKIQALENQKALLICKKPETAIMLERMLKNRFGIQAAVFHEHMNIIERDRAAAYFADPESSARLLVCSEIGSEGRNFQFAHHLILFDLPENPDLLQQRIGRLDRIGQKHEIQIHIPYLQNTDQQILYQWYDQGLNAFRENCSAAHQVYELQKDKLAALMQNNKPEQIVDFIEQTEDLTRQLEIQLHKGRDQLLELNSCRPEKAESIIEQINELEHDGSLWPYMEKLFDSYGVETEYHSQDCYIIRPGNHMRVSHFPELPEDGITVTINRENALVREDMQFLSWEHPMPEAAMDLVLSSETGNATISVVKHDQLDAGQLLLETLFIIECSAPSALQIGRFLPPTPIRILIDHNLHDLTMEISHESLIDSDHSIDFSQFSEFLTGRRKVIDSMLAGAEKKAEEAMADIVNQSDKTMLDTLSNELKRLVRLKKANPSIKEEEIEQFKDIVRASHECIQSAKLKLDAVRVVISS